MSPERDSDGDDRHRGGGISMAVWAVFIRDLAPEDSESYDSTLCIRTQKQWATSGPSFMAGDPLLGLED